MADGHKGILGGSHDNPDHDTRPWRKQFFAPGSKSVFAILKPAYLAESQLFLHRNAKNWF